MRINIEQEQVESFNPIKVEFTFETLKEIQAFAALFNSSPITDFLQGNGMGANNVFDELWTLWQVKGVNVFGSPLTDQLNKAIDSKLLRSFIKE